MSADNENDPPWVLVYGKHKPSVVQHGQDCYPITSEAAPDGRHTTLCTAYVAAIRAGYAPSRWRLLGGSVLMRIDQARHWRSLMEQGVL